MNADDAGTQFASQAHALIAALGSSDGSTDSLRNIAAALASVYAAGLLLPVEDRPARGASVRAALIAPVRWRLDVPRPYYRNADPQRSGTEEVGDLDEDLEDALGEFTRGLSWFDSGSELGRHLARDHWRRTLPHWGHHVVEALRALHYRLHGLPGEAMEQEK